MKMMNRKMFLAGALSGIAVAANTEHVFARALGAAPLPGLPGGQNRVLVLINLQGGNDGLNCVVPYGDAQYYSVRPTIGVPKGDVLDIDSHIGFNPAMRSLKAMYDKGQVAVVQSVGYPNPDHSHFRSTEIWQTAAPDTYEHTGWLGRYLDDAGLPQNNLFNGVAIAQVLPEVLVANQVDVPAIAQINGYGLIGDRNRAARTAYTELVNDERLPFTSPYLQHVIEIEDHAQKGSEELPKHIERPGCLSLEMNRQNILPAGVEQRKCEILGLIARVPDCHHRIVAVAGAPARKFLSEALLYRRYRDRENISNSSGPRCRPSRACCEPVR
jgi:uncharacterized protein (DUF1501 family)